MVTEQNGEDCYLHLNNHNDSDECVYFPTHGFDVKYFESNKNILCAI